MSGNNKLLRGLTDEKQVIFPPDVPEVETKLPVLYRFVGSIQNKAYILYQK